MACPQCGDETVQKYQPFCSKRCADVDLAKWFDGTYTMASDEEPDMDKDSDEGFLN